MLSYSLQEDTATKTIVQLKEEHQAAEDQGRTCALHFSQHSAVSHLCALPKVVAHIGKV